MEDNKNNSYLFKPCGPVRLSKDNLNELLGSCGKNKGKKRLNEIRKLCSKLEKIPNEHSKVTLPKIKTD